MSTEEGFLDALRKNPLDDTTRLIYADWLDEHGDRRGEYLRLELELARLGQDDARRPALEQRGAGLREGIENEWLRQAGKPFDVWLLDYPPPRKIPIIKVIRELTGSGLKDAKDLSEQLPSRIMARLPRGDAERARDHLAQAHAWSSESQPEIANQVCIEPADRASPPLTGSSWSVVLQHLPSSGPFTVTLGAVTGENRLQVIRALRQVTARSLHECLNMTQGPFPVVVVSGVSHDDAQRIRLLFPDSATVSVIQAGVRGS